MNSGNDLNIVGAICARGGSKGVPRKNIRQLYGKPLIAYTIECARAASTLVRTVVSTDDEEIADTARTYGSDVPFMRPAELAQDTSNKWYVFRHLVETLEAQQPNYKVDVLVDLDIGVPTRAPEDIDSCVRELVKSDADVVVTVYEAERNPYFNMVELDALGFAHLVKPRSKPIVSRQQAPVVYSLSPSVFAIKRIALWKVEHWSKAAFKVLLVPRERAIDIDTEVDFQFVRFLMTKDEEKS